MKFIFSFFLIFIVGAPALAQDYDNICTNVEPEIAVSELCRLHRDSIARERPNFTMDGYDISINPTSGEVRCNIYTRYTTNQGVLTELNHQFTLGNEQPCEKIEWCYRDVYRSAAAACGNVAIAMRRTENKTFRVQFAFGEPPEQGTCHFLYHDGGTIKSRIVNMQASQCKGDAPHDNSCRVASNDTTLFKIKTKNRFGPLRVFNFIDANGFPITWKVHQSPAASLIWEENPETGEWFEIDPTDTEKQTVQRLLHRGGLQQALADGNALAEQIADGERGDVVYGLPDEPAQEGFLNLREGENLGDALRAFDVDKFLEDTPEDAQRRRNDDATCPNSTFNYMWADLTQSCEKVVGCSVSDDRAFCGRELDRIAHCQSKAETLIRACGPGSLRSKPAQQIASFMWRMRQGCINCYKYGEGEDNGGVCLAE